jgi:hypothetical protein
MPHGYLHKMENPKDEKGNCDHTVPFFIFVELTAQRCYFTTVNKKTNTTKNTTANTGDSSNSASLAKLSLNSISMLLRE